MTLRRSLTSCLIGFNLSRLYLLQQKYEEAIDGFKKVIEQVPEDFDAHVNVGSAYNLLEQFEEAVPYLEKAVELNPNNVNAWNQLGIAYIRTGQGENIINSLNTIMRKENH